MRGAVQEEAQKQIQAIHAYMDRAGRFTELSGYSCLVAGTLAVAGSIACGLMDLSFRDPNVDRLALGLVWGGVVVLALVQNTYFTIQAMRRKGEPVWSTLTRTVTISILPGFFVAAVITVVCIRENLLPLLPGLWMLAYGSSMVGMSLFTGTHVRLFGIAFLALGAVSVLALQEHGVLMMGLSFGALHVMIGGWVAARYRV